MRQAMSLKNEWPMSLGHGPRTSAAQSRHAPQYTGKLRRLGCNPLARCGAVMTPATTGHSCAWTCLTRAIFSTYDNQAVLNALHQTSSAARRRLHGGVYKSKVSASPRARETQMQS